VLERVSATHQPSTVTPACLVATLLDVVPADCRNERGQDEHSLPVDEAGRRLLAGGPLEGAAA
jgi:hypothetical protein